MSTPVDKTLILNKIIDFYKFRTQKEFADFLGIPNTTLSSWLKRSTFDVELLYSKCVGINPAFLLTGKGPVKAEDQQINSVPVKDSQQVGKGNIPALVTVDSSGRDNIILVPVKAAAGYLNGYGDPKFIERLPVYNLPNMNNGTYRMFQVSGHSMYPTLTDKSYVVGQWVEDIYRDVKDDRIYVIVSRNDGVIVKRVLNRLDKYNNLFCKSDNRREYPSISVHPGDIIEVWEVKMHLSFNLPNPADFYDRLNDLEAEVEHLKTQIA